MPVAAVRPRDTVSIIMGSLKDTMGTLRQLTMTNFSLVARSVSTQ